MSLKSYLQLLVSKIGVLDVETSSLITGSAVVPAGHNAKENRLSGIAPFSGYVTATVKFKASVVNLMVNSQTLMQVISQVSEDVCYQTVCAPCSKGDSVELATLALEDGDMELKFFAINNGK